MLTNSTPRLSLLLLVSLVALSWLSIYLTHPPQAKPASAPLTEFSAERAMQYVRQIAREPHVIGTGLPSVAVGLFIGTRDVPGIRHGHSIKWLFYQMVILSTRMAPYRHNGMFKPLAQVVN